MKGTMKYYFFQTFLITNQTGHISALHFFMLCLISTAPEMEYQTKTRAFIYQMHTKSAACLQLIQ